MSAFIVLSCGIAKEWITLSQWIPVYVHNLNSAQLNIHGKYYIVIITKSVTTDLYSKYTDLNMIYNNNS